MSHASGVSLQASAAQQSLQARARALAQTLERACTVTAAAAAQPAHAAPGRVVCRAPSLARALYEVELVREDPAAFVHNAALARSLLDDAERLTGQAPIRRAEQHAPTRSPRNRKGSGPRRQ